MVFGSSNDSKGGNLPGSVSSEGSKNASCRMRIAVKTSTEQGKPSSVLQELAGPHGDRWKGLMVRKTDNLRKETYEYDVVISGDRTRRTDTEATGAYILEFGVGDLKAMKEADLPAEAGNRNIKAAIPSVPPKNELRADVNVNREITQSDSIAISKLSDFTDASTVSEGDIKR